MKIHKIVGISLFSILILLIGCLFTGCGDNDINIGKEDEGKYQPNENIVAYVVNEKGRQITGLTEFRKEGETKLRVKLNHAAPEAIAAKFIYKEEILKAYNSENGTDYELFPQANVEIKDNGAVQIAIGGIESNETGLVIKSDGSFDSNKSYVIPLTIAIEAGGNSLASQEVSYLVFIKDLTGIPSAEKLAKGDDGIYRRVEIISCMEMGDTNPLNNLSFTLKNSGKPLVDVLVMFSGNVKYSETEGRVYLSLNNPIQHVLDNQHEFIKPLKDRGIKVVMGVMPHHDRVSLTNMSKETAEEFVKELKAYIDAYDLDGVFWDEEYSAMISPPPPGFVESSKLALSNLIHEFNRVMPDKQNIVYDYGIWGLSSVDGNQGGEYITHILYDYGSNGNPANGYAGLPKSGWGMHSQEFAQGRVAGVSALNDIRNNGYCNMIFAMDPFRSNYNRSQLPAMQRMASVIFEDELVVDKNFYVKDY